MKFAELAANFEALEKTTSRNVMTEMVAELLKEVEVVEVKPVLYIMTGNLGPAFAKIDFGIADKMVVRALAILAAKTETAVWQEYKRVGDLGKLGEWLSGQQGLGRGQGKTVAEVYEELIKIAQDGGDGSQERKINSLARLCQSLSPQEMKFVVRLVLGRLRLGFSDRTLLDALSVMERGNKGGKEVLEMAYQVMPDIGEIAVRVKREGIKDMEKKVTVRLGVPVMPALCQRLKTAEEMINKMGEVLVEPKFDGTRVQIHVRKNQGLSGERWMVKTFTRNLEDTSTMFPELTKGLIQVKAKEVILDSEAVGIHPKTGKMLPFQMTITRKRIHGIEEAARTVPLKFFVFDILYKDGVSLIGKPLIKRRQILAETIVKGPVLQVDESVTTSEAAELRTYHKQQLAQGLEGVVVKQIRSVYEPGRRGWSWVKFKEIEEAQAKLADTIDGVVMGFYRGKGKRTQFGIGAFLVGIWGEGLKMEKIVTIAKIGTGLTDEQWREMKRRLEARVAFEKPSIYVVEKNLEPDVWVDPAVVVEIAADEITVSPNHSAGYALRFPRLVKFRDDKGIETITTTEEVLQIRGKS